MATDPKDKELTGVEAEDVQGGATPKKLSPGEDAEITVDPRVEEKLKGVAAGRTQRDMPKRVE